MHYFTVVHSTYASDITYVSFTRQVDTRLVLRALFSPRLFSLRIIYCSRPRRRLAHRVLPRRHVVMSWIPCYHC